MLVSPSLALSYSPEAVYSFELSSGLANLNQVTWDAQLPEDSTLLSMHVAYFAQAGFEPYFVKVVVEGDCIMQVLCYDSPLHIENVEQNLSNKSWFIKTAYKSGLKLLGENRRMLICGHPHLIGDLGIACHVGLSPEEKANILRLVILRIQKEKGVTKLAVIKEFVDSKWQCVEMKTFQGFAADDNYVMPIDPNWESIEDYAACLNSKYRTKRKSDLKKSEEFEMQNWSAEQIEQQAERITLLYKQVLANANFYLGKIDAHHLAQMKRENPDRFSFKVLVNDQGSPVAFFTGWLVQKRFDAFLIGMDYEMVGKKGLYSTILHRYVEQAIELKAEQLVFGRTGGLAKSSVGAFPQKARCFITHRSPLIRTILGVVFRQVKPTEYPYRNPWKKEQLDAWEGSQTLTSLHLAVQR